jgi:3-deoxy-D-manno-octulosonate 8-phosphate phosphatase (KDO 8-P phosphatase)
MINYKEALIHINTFVFDYDGVFTNGTVILQNSGDPLRTANVKDGYALQLAIKKGYRIVVISGGKSDSISNRFDTLNVTDVFLSVDNKIEVYKKYLKDHGLEAKNVLYMGDDIPDYKVMQEAGVATCPADAAEEIKSISHYISHFNGGEGCVRDILEQVMKVQGKWMTDEGFHW